MRIADRVLEDIPGKSKDVLNARIDLEEMGIRMELTPQKDGEKTYLPAACYNLSKQEKKAILYDTFRAKGPGRILLKF